MRAAIAAGAVVVALAGCGGSDGGGGYVPPKGPPVKTVTVVGDHFRFAPKQISVPAGIIEFELEAKDIQHTLVIEGIPGFIVEAGVGDPGTGKVKLAKGKYTFYCNVSGHRAAGMQGTLTVG